MAKRQAACDQATMPIGVVRPVAALVVLFFCLVVLRGRLEGVDLGSVVTHIQGISPIQWIVALGLTAGSFAAVGLYDDYVHRWLNTGVASHRAAVSGAASIAVAQMVGLGLVTGTFARWRMLPGLPILQVAQITAAVSASFMVALVVVIAGAQLIGPAPEHAPNWLVPAGVTVAALAVCASLLRPNRLPLSLPPLRIMGGVLATTLVDTILAGLAFYVLLPAETDLTAQVLMPAFLIALGAGLISGTPAGAGAFELTLILLLPFVPEPELLATIVAFRVIYYVLPASVGAAVLLFRFTPATVPSGRGKQSAPPRATRAEAGLARLEEFDVVTLDRTCMLVADSGQALVALGDPLLGASKPALRELAQAAERRGLIPAIYKCSARVAVEARQEGWSSIHCADELWVDPTAFSPNIPSRRQLRRKLRAAAASGVTVEPVTGPLPVQALANVAQAWARARGGERGFSMGRWDPDYVAGQQCYVARVGGRIIAFATFHVGAQDWTLDLLRSTEATPDGTMHQIIATAIEDAGRLGCNRLSLAALPPARQPRLLRQMALRFGPTEGLRQFKISFAPAQEPLYLISPGPLGLVLAAFDILRRVMWPVPIGKTARPAPTALREHAWNSVSS